MVICESWSDWLKQHRFSYMDEEQVIQTLTWLHQVKDKVLGLAELKENETIVDIGCGLGLLGIGAIEETKGKSKVFFTDKFEDCVQECQKMLEDLKIDKKAYECKVSPIEKMIFDTNTVDKAMTRSVLVHVMDKLQALSEVHRILKPEGVYAAFEPLISSNTKYYELVDENCISDYKDFKQAEWEIMNDKNSPITNYNEETLRDNFQELGFSSCNLNVETTESHYIVKESMIEPWLMTPPSPFEKSIKDKLLTYFEEPKVLNYIEELKKALNNKPVCVKTRILLIRAVK